ncbi:MAG: citrate synthase/methylcitrate synthase [Chloroflexota bacterium]
MQMTSRSHPKTNGFVPGLEGIIAAQTQLSAIDGKKGQLVISGYPLEEIASQATFEELIYLLWYHHLPTTKELNDFARQLTQWRTLPDATLSLLSYAAKEKKTVMDALRMAVGTLDLELATEPNDRLRLACAIQARMPMVVAAYWRLRQGEAPILEVPEMGFAASYLYLLTGETPAPEQAKALETYLNTVAEHGLNASAFTARVISSTHTDLLSAVVGAIGALKGPLHGGAPGPALDMVFEIREMDRAEAVLREKLDRGERLMGFGHRVYKVHDPRAAVLADAAEKLYEEAGDRALYELARHVEEKAIELLVEYKPGRHLKTNVEFYTALLLHGIGLETELFTPTFAVARTAGWIAHCFEQVDHGRIIRPKALYQGRQDARYVPLSERD